MLLINEWLPNPTGSDTTGEWIELYNSGPETIALANYSIIAEKGKPYIFGAQTLQPNQYLLLPRPASKITLRNENESLTLSDPSGIVIDTSKFVGTAADGKSFSRMSGDGSVFLFTTPTPGAPNYIPAVANVSANYQFGVPLHPAVSGYEWIGLALAVGIGLTIAIMTIIGRDAPLHQLFFE